jgi:AcrR family transcriptional regulator
LRRDRAFRKTGTTVPSPAIRQCDGGAEALAIKLNIKLNIAMARPNASRKSARPRRPAGRPPGDAPDLRGRLLDAALERFARNGIAATSLRTIAIEAGVNPALVHYYFGDKARLQEAVVQERLLPALAVVREAVQQASDVAGLVAAFVRGIGDIVVQHSWFPSLWVREVLCEGGALRDVLFDHIAPQLPQLMARRFADAQRDGELNPDLDPRLVVVSLVGLTLFPAASAPIWRRLFEADDIDAALLRDHAIALLDRGLGVG